MTTLTLPNVTHLSIVLLPHVPCDYHSSVCLSLQRGQPNSPRELSHRGIIVPVQIDHDEHDWLLGHPTVYLRVRPDQRWVLAILPFPVERTANQFQGMRCEVLLSSECVTEIDREQLMKQFEADAFNFNQAAINRMDPFDLDAIAAVYRSAMHTMTKIVMFQGGFAEDKIKLTLDMLSMYTYCTEACVGMFTPDQLPSDEEIASCTGNDFTPLLPPGLLDTFSNYQPLVESAKPPPQGHAETYLTASTTFPHYDHDCRLAIEESMQLCGNKGFTPTLLIRASPCSSRNSGFLIYYPLPKSVDILAIGVNADERRQGYGYQLLMHLARMYPNTPIQAKVLPPNTLSNLLYEIRSRQTSACSDGSMEWVFTYENFFPVERKFLESFHSVQKKFRKRRKK